MATDIIGSIIKVGLAVYDMAQRVKSNKKRCARLAEKIDALRKPLAGT